MVLVFCIKYITLNNLFSDTSISYFLFRLDLYLPSFSITVTSKKCEVRTYAHSEYFIPSVLKDLYYLISDSFSEYKISPIDFIPDF